MAQIYFYYLLTNRKMLHKLASQQQPADYANAVFVNKEETEHQTFCFLNASYKIYMQHICRYTHCRHRHGQYWTTM